MAYESSFIARHNIYHQQESNPRQPFRSIHFTILSHRTASVAHGFGSLTLPHIHSTKNKFQPSKLC
ncbi:MAG: hypothetical protein LCH67_20285 [Bacteroidetes bacterium]|nr:hypothetical protein [Bacteroidota bacterium]